MEIKGDGSEEVLEGNEEALKVNEQALRGEGMTLKGGRWHGKATERR